LTGIFQTSLETDRVTTRRINHLPLCRAVSGRQSQPGEWVYPKRGYCGTPAFGVREHQTIVRMERNIGEFVVHGTTLASLALEDPPKKEIIGDLQAAYSINRYRMVEHDSAFGIRQIVDIALRSLSPASTTPRRP
jgi:hypothetical protein